VGNCKHEFEEVREPFCGVVVRCLLCGYECDHSDTDEGMCLDCDYVLPYQDDREDRAYEEWRERESA